jgi:hypothetical protein
LANTIAINAAASITHDNGFHIKPRNLRTLFSCTTEVNTSHESQHIILMQTVFSRKNFLKSEEKRKLIHLRKKKDQDLTLEIWRKQSTCVPLPIPS